METLKAVAFEVLRFIEALCDLVCNFKLSLTQ